MTVGTSRRARRKHLHDLPDLHLPRLKTVMARGRDKREERQIRAAHRRNKKERRHQQDGDEAGDGGDFLSLKQQLEVLGLTLREIQGDGNCLFRAISDQLTGSSDKHFSLRKEVVDYLGRHRSEFEPFLVDETSYDRHLELLGQDGTFGGNDSIVALARLYDATIVIHQLNERLWKVHGSPDGSTPCHLELHVSYHNGDHYNSVRKISEQKHLRTPADIRICTIQNEANFQRQSHPDDAHARSLYDDDSEDEQNHGNSYDDDDDVVDLSDYENASKEDALVRRTMRLSGTTDERLVQDCLEHNDFHVEAAVEQLKKHRLRIESEKSHLWCETGTGRRIFGDDVARNTFVASHDLDRQKPRSGNADRMANIRQKLNENSARLSNKQRQRLKREERKLARDDRRRQEVKGGSHQSKGNAVIVANLETLSI